MGLVSVYPNPAKDVLNVEVVIGSIESSTYHDMSLRLVTMQGVVVAKQNVTGIQNGLNKTSMDITELPNGAYLLKVECGEIHRIVKVVVNK
jgi:hypothetical protein